MSRRLWGRFWWWSLMTVMGVSGHGNDATGSGVSCVKAETRTEGVIKRTLGRLLLRHAACCMPICASLAIPDSLPCTRPLSLCSSFRFRRARFRPSRRRPYITALLPCLSARRLSISLSLSLTTRQSHTHTHTHTHNFYLSLSLSLSLSLLSLSLLSL